MRHAHTHTHTRAQQTNTQTPNVEHAPCKHTDGKRPRRLTAGWDEIGAPGQHRIRGIDHVAPSPCSWFLGFLHPIHYGPFPSEGCTPTNRAHGVIRQGTSRWSVGRVCGDGCRVLARDDRERVLNGFPRNHAAEFKRRFLAVGGPQLGHGYIHAPLINTSAQRHLVRRLETAWRLVAERVLCIIEKARQQHMQPAP